MQLSDIDIKVGIITDKIKVSELKEEDVQPASVDVHLGGHFIGYKSSGDYIDATDKESIQQETYEIHKEVGDTIMLAPGEFLLGCTIEEVGVDNAHSAQIIGKSSLARLGLIVHTTAGFIDPGNSLVPTLEFCNHNNRPLQLTIGMPIAQIIFNKLSSECSMPYGHKDRNSKYYNSQSTETSKNYKNF